MRKKVLTILTLFLCLILSSTQLISEPIIINTSLTPTADSYVYGSASHTNEGASPFLRIRKAIKNRALINFDKSLIQSTIGENPLISAKLRLYITENKQSWGKTGREISLHLINHLWVEGNGYVQEAPEDESTKGSGEGVTWDCAIDPNIDSKKESCSSQNAWEMENPNNLPFNQNQIAELLITDNTSGYIEFDVTQSILEILNGSEFYGFLIKKVDENKNGELKFSSKEGLSSPELILSYEEEQDDIAPVVKITLPEHQNTLAQNSIEVIGTIDDETAIVLVNGIQATISQNTFSLQSLSLTEGENQITVTATDPAGNVGTDTITVFVDTASPVVQITEPANGRTINKTRVNVSGTISEENTSVLVNGQVANVNATSFLKEQLSLEEGENTITATATDLAGNTGSDTISINVDTTIPDSPEEVAPEINKTVSTILGNNINFLFEGENPIQKDLVPGTLEAKRTAVIRGEVRDANASAIPGAKITIVNHPEYGYTGTRSNGLFDIAINGGQSLTVQIEKPGYLPVQRTTKTNWQDFSWISDVVLTKLDTKVSTINLQTNPGTLHSSSPSIDINGERTTRVFIPSQTTAELVFSDNTSLPLETINIRATEYTVGASGKEAMPAELPPTSAYTFAAELSIDEAISQGAKEVIFSKQIPFYVDNFLDFPVGTIVPVGYYDREKTQWIAEVDGTVIKILTTSPEVTIDITGDDIADELSSLAISQEELQALSQAYNPGAEIWRVSTNHFTPFDCNWSFGFPLDAKANTEKGDTPDGNKQDLSCKVPGSIIDTQNQILGEEIPLEGSPFSLSYQSDRVPGRKAGRQIEIPVSGSSIPGSLQSIELEILIAGQRHRFSYPAQTNQSHTFIWDGKDAYGRDVQGSKVATIRIGYVYQAVYLASGRRGRSFASFGSGVEIGVNRQDLTNSLIQEYRLTLNNLDYRENAIAGWSINGAHFYDFNSKTLYLGDGERRSAKDELISSSGITEDAVFKRLVGYLCTEATTPAPAKERCIANPRGFDIAPDGRIYVATGNKKIYEISTDGTLSEFFSTQTFFSFDLGALAVDKDSNIYIVDGGNHRVWRLTQNKQLSPFAGNGQDGRISGSCDEVDLSGDEGLARNAKLYFPSDSFLGVRSGLAFGPDGSLYIGQHRAVRKVTLDGRIYTVAGTGQANASRSCLYFGETGEGRAKETPIGQITGLAFDSNNNLYFADHSNRRVAKVSTDGILTTFAGLRANYNGAIIASGTSAKGTPLGIIADITFGTKGEAYIAGERGIVVVNQDGIIIDHIETSKRVQHLGFDKSEQISTNNAVSLTFIGRVSQYDPLWRSDPESQGQILKREVILPNFLDESFSLASKSGDLLYGFDNEGRHIRTTSTLTGEVLLSLSYNQEGKLTNLVDPFGNTTTINWSGDTPVNIISPYGHVTSLTTNQDGYLESVTNEAEESYQMAYLDSEGLLKSFKMPNGAESSFTYDSLGFLTKDTDDKGGYLELLRNVLDKEQKTWTVNTQSSLGRTTSYKVEVDSNRDIKHTNTFSDGSSASSLMTKSGEVQVKTASNLEINSKAKEDPRFKMQSPLSALEQIVSPDGQTLSSASNKEVSLSDKTDNLSLVSQTTNTSLNGKTYSASYDQQTKSQTTITPEGRETTTYIDNFLRTTKVEIPELAAVNFSYEQRGRLEEVTIGTRSTRYSYGADGYVSKITDSLNREVILERDEIGRITKQILPDLREINYSYDANGNLLSLTPPGRPAHEFRYTSIDQTSEYLPPVTTDIQEPKTVYTYNLDKDLESVLRPDGKLIDYVYSGNGQLESIITPEGSYDFSYDPLSGQLTQGTAPSGVNLTFTYNGDLLKSTSWSGAITGTVSKTYNNDYQLSSLRVNNQSQVNYAYDQDNLLTQAGDVTLTRNSNNGLLEETSLGNLKTSIAYNEYAEVETETYLAGTTELYKNIYSYDQIGRIKTKTETVDGTTKTYEYIYDQAGRLKEVKENNITKTTYGYDSNSNRTHLNGNLVGVYDEQDRLISYNGNTYTYTKNGEIKTKTDSQGTTTYSYDVFGNLISVELPNTNTIEYLIDSEDRRVGKKVNGVLTQQYLYGDSLNPIAELDGQGNVVSEFVYGAKVNVPDYIIKGNVTYRVISNHLGSVVGVVDINSFTLAQYLEYDEFGRVLVDTNPGFQPFGFVGGMYEAETGLVRFGARDYDAEVGRWTAKDPILFDGGDSNLYGYVAVDPVNFVDLDGELGFLATALVGGLVDAGIDLAFQLISNGGNLSCVDVGSLGRSFVSGAVIGATGFGLVKGIKKLGKLPNLLGNEIGAINPNLKLSFLHPKSSLSLAKINKFKKVSTEDLIKSLTQGEARLKIKPSGRVMDGHHRLNELLDRGFDINKLIEKAEIYDL